MPAAMSFSTDSRWRIPTPNSFVDRGFHDIRGLALNRKIQPHTKFYKLIQSAAGGTEDEWSLGQFGQFDDPPNQGVTRRGERNDFMQSTWLINNRWRMRRIGNNSDIQLRLQNPPLQHMAIVSFKDKSKSGMGCPKSFEQLGQ
jgi:hypothetical protein